MAFRKLAERLKVADVGGLSLQLLQPIPGMPLALRADEERDERLPGMRRWVERAMLERAIAAEGAGTSDSFVNSELNRSLAAKSLMGAVAGGGLASHGQGTPLRNILTGALVGGGLGAAYHGTRRGDVLGDAEEALHGAQRELAQYPREQTALPQERQDESSAAAVAPTLLHTAPSVAY